jgi:hypothetical protein
MQGNEPYKESIFGMMVAVQCTEKEFEAKTVIR